MKIENINAKCATVKNGCPLFLKGTNGRAVLLLHGYNGYVQDVRFLAEQLNRSGFTVYAPRNTGCGTDHTDFLETTAHDWVRHAVDCYLDLRSEYTDISLVGLSMGGLLSIILSSRFKTDKLVLAAPALILHTPLLPFTMIIRFFIKKIPRKQNKKQTVVSKNREFSQELDFLQVEYWNWHYIPLLFQLRKVQKLALRSLKKVKADTLIFVSKSDRTVSIKTAEIITKKTGSQRCRTEVLEKSQHVITNGVDREVVAQSTIDWLN
ncbi:MAG: alpha/beta fold hydrolase [Spirochaetes bacterium]|jgi:carboxylesterase|nr:alpha/beta fold hydrolase [Spirochaetota bacterium]